MKRFALTFFVASAGIVLPAGAVEPVPVSEGVIIEEAWARVGTAGLTEIFLVVNNRSASDANLSVQVPGANDARVIDATGRSIKPSIPLHSELYMEPEGVRIVATGLARSSTVTVKVTVGNGDPVVIKAEVLMDGLPLPDHHDYNHG